VRADGVGSVEGMLYGQEHVERYRETNGQEGHEWRPGVHTLLLTTTGHRSGAPRTAPLIYGRQGDAFVVVASKGGSDDPPAWYVNLIEDPSVEVQVEDERFPATARVAVGDEREELWRAMAEIWPAYDEYQQKTEREIPVVVLERA
jgi:deazaflavin-dependent oxidoreductase (nitroreductase family)